MVFSLKCKPYKYLHTVDSQMLSYNIFLFFFKLTFNYLQNYSQTEYVIRDMHGKAALKNKKTYCRHDSAFPGTVSDLSLPYQIKDG